MKLRVFLFLSLFIFSYSSAIAAPTCNSLFEVKKIEAIKYDYSGANKLLILEEAIFHSRLKIERVNYYEVLNRWNLKNSTPAKMEMLAQAIVVNINKKSSFTHWLKNLVLKKNAVKEALKIRAETLILARELQDALEIRGLLKKDSRLDNTRAFFRDNFNKIQLAKLFLINSATFYFLGVPLYVPNFDWVKNLDLTEKDLTAIHHLGFEKAYPSIASNYNHQLRVQRVMEHAPQVLILSIAGYIGYNYLMFNPSVVRNELPLEQAIPQRHQLYLEWKKSYEEQTGRKADLKNPQDRQEWETTVQSIYGAWADLYKEREGHYPDLSKDQDRRAWEKFLSTFDN